jgi:IS5 family transposase
VLRLPEELARVDALLDDPAFFAPYFHPVTGRPSTPAECYLRLMFLKFRYRLGFESLCAEVSDSISWRRFCRIPLDGKVPHPTTLMKLTSRCGEAAVAGLNEALRAKAAGQKLLRTARVRADTTVIPANVAYPADSGLLAKAAGGGPAGAPDRQQAAHPREARPGGKHPGDRPGDRGARGLSGEDCGGSRRGAAQRAPGGAEGAQRADARPAAAGAR